jgi:murein DD-endopeptidase MepM/ murein hydrolase activator NlpD
MGNIPVDWCSRVEVCAARFRAGGLSGWPLRPARRLTCVAVIALAAAGCSQEVQRFDHGARESRTAQLHYNEARYAERAQASWRRDERGDLDQRRAQLSADPITRSLPRSDDRRSNFAAPEPLPPRRQTHTVRPGDTLYSIARSYNVSVDDLARTNALSDPSRILVGDTLHIPEAGYQPRPRQRASQPRDRRETQPALRYAERSAPRYSDDQLYIDPLLSEQPQREQRRGHDMPRRTHERPRRQHRGIATAEPPPAPAPRPESRQPNEVAGAPERASDRVQQPEGPRVARAEPQQERAVASEQKTSGAECRALMKNPPARSGANFRRPVNGLVISRFGEQADGRRNDGINISVPRGTPVKAAENGVVVYAGDELMGLGNLVLVRHADGWVSAYAHNDEIVVKRCDTVERGQTIAHAGVSGSVTKPQLHFELRKNAEPVDPEQHLAGTS